MGPVVRVGLEPEELSEVFSSRAAPAATLAFKAAVDAHFDVFLNHAAAASHRSDLAADRAAQFGRDKAPVIYAFAVAQDIAKEGVERFAAAVLQGACTQRFEHGLALGFP